MALINLRKKKKTSNVPFTKQVSWTKTIYTLITSKAGKLYRNNVWKFYHRQQHLFKTEDIIWPLSIVSYRSHTS